MARGNLSQAVRTGIGKARLAYVIAEAVATTGIGRTTLYGLMASGQLPFVKLGNRTLIRHVGLEQLLERNLARAVSSPPVVAEAIVDKESMAA